MRVIYATEAFLPKSGGRPGRQIELSFPSLEEAIAAPLPEGCVFAFVPVENGRHVYSIMGGWEFHRSVGSVPAETIANILN